MEVVVRKVWLPVKVLQKKPAPFQPIPVIYKAKRLNADGTLQRNQNVIYRIPGSVGKCYEFAFVRAFTRTDAEKYVCCGCRVLKVKSDPRSKGKKVPWVQIQKGKFHEDPANPANATHFCRPKTTVDVITGGHMSSLKNTALFTPITRGSRPKLEEQKKVMPSVKEREIGIPDVPQIMDDWFRNEHCYIATGQEKKKQNYPRISKANQAQLVQKAIRISSIGPKRIMSKLPDAEDQCYEFVEKKTRSVYFDVYHCTACSRKKDLEGHRVGPIPAVHLRGDHYLTDPCNPKHPHYCSPKNVAEVLVHGEMAKILHENPQIPIETEELFIKLREKCTEQDGYIRAFEQDKLRVQALEKKLLNRNIAIKMLEERVERIAKEKAEGNQKHPTPPPTLERQIKTDSLSPESNTSSDESIEESQLKAAMDPVEVKPLAAKRSLSSALSGPYDMSSKPIDHFRPLKRMSSMPILEPITINLRSKQQSKITLKKSPIPIVAPYFPTRTSRPVSTHQPLPMLFPVRVVPREDIRRAASLPTKELK